MARLALRRPLRIAAAAPVGIGILELAGRAIARRSLVDTVVGWDLSPWTVCAFVAVAAAALSTSWVRARTGLLFAALFAAGLAAQLSLGARLQSDGFYYFAYLRSLAFDGDVDFANDYRLLGLGDKPHLFEPTPTGYAQSAWTIGPAFVWAPFFAAGHVVAVSLNARDPNVSTNGISFPYRQAVCVAGLFYGLLAAWFMYRFASRAFDRALAAVAVALVIAGSFMLWYLVKEPSMTHAPSLAAVAAFAWFWGATRNGRTRRQWILLGLLAGFATLVRWQNAIFAILPAADAVGAVYSAWRTSDRDRLHRTLTGGLLFTAAATLAFVPQMLAWKAIYGSWLAISPVGPQIRFADPYIVDILWSSRNGLLSTSPVLYLAAAGLVCVALLRPGVGAAPLLAVALMTYFNACIQDWAGSAGFGGRRFDGTLPFFVLGVAQVLVFTVALLRRFPVAAASTAGAVLILWNLSLISAAHAGMIKIGEAVSFGDVLAAQSRILHRWFGNPFTYPASLAFAIRNGVSPSRYDLLSGNRFLGDPTRPYGRIDVGGADEWLLDEGWHQPEHEGSTSFRWASERALVLVPLDRVDDLHLQVRLHSFGYPGAPEQRLTAVVNGRHQSGVAVPPAWQTVEVYVARDAWRQGVNRVALEFSWARRPSDVGLGADGRPLAAAVDYVRIAVPPR